METLYSLNPGVFDTHFGKHFYLQKINLRYLFTEQWNCLPSLFEDNIIYCIQNNLNLKCYIGQARNLFNRMINGTDFMPSHKQSYSDYCENGGNSVLYRALNKYKSRNFTVYILDELDNSDSLDAFEQYWIDHLHTCIFDDQCWGYNMNYGGNSGAHLLSEESRRKSRESIAARYGGDPIGQLHTPKALKNNIESRKRTWNGDVCGMCHTKEAQQKANQSKLINGIISRVNLLKFNNLELTPINYFSYIPDSIKGHCLEGIQLSHIEKVCNRLYDDPPITSNPDWDPIWTPLFNWFDNQDNFESLSKLRVKQVASPDQ